MLSIIDIHVHTFPDKIAKTAIQKITSNSPAKAFTDGTQDGLISSMNDSGIKYSVVQPVATSPSQVVHINDSAIKINNNFKNTGVFSFGAIHPDFEDYHSELKRISDAGIKGVKLHPVYQGVNIDDSRYIKILERSGELGLIILIHAGWDIGFPGAEQALPEKIYKAIKSSGPATFILAHMGGWKCWDDAEKLFSTNSDVYIDTAFSLGLVNTNDGRYLNMLSEKDFIRIVKNFGTDRVLFGTDSPWSPQSKEIDSIKNLPLTEKEKSAIFYENAAKLLKI